MKERGRHQDMATREFCQIQKRVPPTVVHRIKKPYITIIQLNIHYLLIIVMPKIYVFSNSNFKVVSKKFTFMCNYSKHLFKEV